MSHPSPAGEPGEDGLARRERLLADAFVTLADTLVDEYDMIDLLDSLVGYSVALLAVDAAGLLLGDARRELRVVAASSEDAQLMEFLALQADEGPCIDCYQSAAPVGVPDLAATRDRWPVFTAAVAERGAFASAHALPLRLRGQAIGALTLFHATPGPLPAADLLVGQALADVATIGILSERAIRRSEVLNEQLQTALTQRVVIEQAKGVLSQQAGIDLDAAFHRMRGHARSGHHRLVDVARQLIAGELDADMLPPATIDPDQQD